MDETPFKTPDGIRAREAIRSMVTDYPGETYWVLWDLHNLNRLIGELSHTAVAAARHDGLTWEQIGQALGLTKQAAQQRYGR